MTKILCIGSACKDMFFPTSEGEVIDTPEDITSQKKISFELGAKYQIEERHEALGGCAANVSVGLARLGIEADVATTVGDDEIGKWIKEELEKNGVMTTFFKEEVGKKSDLSTVIVEKESADRVIFSNKSAKNNLELQADDLKEIEWLVLGDIQGSWQDQMEDIIEKAKGEKVKIALNPREVHIKENAAEIIEAIGLSEVVFVNKDEAIEIVSRMKTDASLEMLNDENFLLEKFIELEPKVVVITDGKKGAWATDGEKIFFAKGLSVPAVDSTGAGDAFLSGFLAAYAKEKEIEECLKWGIANSANEVQFYGAIDGLLSEKNILEKIEEVMVEEMKK
jgi:ribokinase